MTTSIQKDALLSQFSNLAYKDERYLSIADNLPDGWSLKLAEVSPPFAAFAFKNDLTGEVVIAYRGTDGLTDAGADMAILSGNWNPQFQRGMDFVASVISKPNILLDASDASKLLVTGHSLGGTIAQIVAQAYGLNGSAMDPGAAARIVNTEGFREAVLAAGLPQGGVGISAAFSNHLVAGSLVSGSTGSHLGTVTYLPSESFNSMQALTAFAISALNPLAGFVFVAGLDQVGNKHASESISQSMLLLAGMGDGTQSGPLILAPKIVRMEFDALTSTEKPVFSQTELEVRDTAGNILNSLKFSGQGTERKLEVFDAAGNPKMTVTQALGGGIVTVFAIDQPTIEIRSLPESITNEDGTVQTITRDRDGTLISTATRQMFEDGSAILTTEYPDGHSVVITTGTSGLPYQSIDFLADGRTVSKTFSSDGVLLRTSEKQVVDGGGSIEIITTVSGTIQRTTDAQGNASDTPVESGNGNLTQAIATTASFLSLIKAIQTGQPLPIATAGVNTLISLQNFATNGHADINLSGTGASLSALTSLYSLQKISSAAMYWDPSRQAHKP